MSSAMRQRDTDKGIGFILSQMNSLIGTVLNCFPSFQDGEEQVILSKSTIG